ncbi:hypothetical protein [Mycoplasma mycoides]|uniref:Tetracyclin repressor-like C-terminal domain-containing protein n=1 Tax=Mycoplasma mycoides subsp. capri TaxID=40477 RepID=A0AB38GDL4_MYCMC|nr:hypothetical protein [Mycoplasma mycoides]ADH22004.1 conserved hypothetical protein [synthetic Mycoplasma mycoides JCVI-syn1.0]ACU79012.1 conserved hypothetical protein [Mycoplasma mycoides subsp. capri str. GM12]ACU79844.1 conserved hypothetical protein [Mycoplasma mycoides subsp. capri str. GM12]SRX58676.1 hypothetical protein MMC68K_00316 [Mycoplasma mycoides subsp. capri]SRX61259.1 hypothetical protein MMC68C_00308 [Mycoplasma mycoides subsp. capri]
MKEIRSFNLLEFVNRFSLLELLRYEFKNQKTLTNKEKEFLDIAKQYTLTYPLKVSIDDMLKQIESNKIENDDVKWETQIAVIKYWIGSELIDIFLKDFKSKKTIIDNKNLTEQWMFGYLKKVYEQLFINKLKEFKTECEKYQDVLFVDLFITKLEEWINDKNDIKTFEWYLNKNWDGFNYFYSYLDKKEFKDSTIMNKKEDFINICFAFFNNSKIRINLYEDLELALSLIFGNKEFIKQATDVINAGPPTLKYFILNQLIKVEKIK